MPHAVDVHVGHRLRQRRWVLSMSQNELADRIGVRFQQIQKYESGANRVSASRLHDIACEMEVPVAYFFEGLQDFDDGAPHVAGGVVIDKEAMALIRVYYAIPEAQRRRLFELARVLGAASADAHSPSGSSQA